MKFKKGDIIIGNDKNRYGITRCGVKCTVRNNESEYGKINVVVGEYKKIPFYETDFTVESKYFDLVKRVGIQFK